MQEAKLATSKCYSMLKRHQVLIEITFFIAFDGQEIKIDVNHALATSLKEQNDINGLFYRVENSKDLSQSSF